MDRSDKLAPIMRDIPPEGPAVRQVWSTGMDWISRCGLVEVARDQEVTGPDDVA